MRLVLTSSVLIALRRIFLTLGCIMALSACTTAGEGTKTSLLSSAATTSNAERNSDRADSPDSYVGENGEGPNEDKSLAALDTPALPQNGPLPATRSEPQAMLAFAGAQAAASPSSLASNIAFETPAHAPDNLDGLISKYSTAYEVPERLVRRVVHRESRFNPAARNGPYWGLMQISHPTARGMGYSGPAHGLLDAETNLKYAVRYLAGAYKVADGNESQAVRLYARGYYYDAKRKGLLRETGLDGSFRRQASKQAADTSSAATVSAVPTPAAAPIQASLTSSEQ